MAVGLSGQELVPRMEDSIMKADEISLNLNNLGK